MHPFEPRTLECETSALDRCATSEQILFNNNKGTVMVHMKYSVPTLDGSLPKHAI